MLKPLVILGLSLTFVGCATNSSSTASATNNSGTEKVVKKDDKKRQIICKRQARVGSHFKKTQCWTAEEYAAKQERDRQEIKRIQNNSAGVSAPEGR